MFNKCNFLQVSFIILLALSSCAQVNYTSLFGKKTKYLVYRKKVNEPISLIDTLSISPTKSSNSYFFHRNTIEIAYETWDNSKKVKEWTGADLKVNKFGFHLPRSTDYYFMAIIPFPSMNLPPNLTTQTTSEMTIAKSHYKSLEGKVVKQRLDVTAKKDTLINGINRVVYIQQGENLNLVKEEGKYTCEYHFNEDLGYVFLRFVRPNGEIIDWRKIYP